MDIYNISNGIKIFGKSLMLNYRKFKKIKRPLIIAEIGNNHEGKFSVAKKLIDLAAEAGVDAVKFQTFRTKKFVIDKEKKRFNKFQKFELRYLDFEKLSIYAKKKKLLFISTPFDLESAVFLNKIVDCFKISSGDNNFFELIQKVLSFNKPVIISLGLLTFSEIVKLEKFVKKQKNKNVYFLHCITSYPAEDTEIDLKTIEYLKKRIKLKIGYSDHSLGPDAAILAATLGAEIIEKHFTISKNFSSFRDHKLSADLNEMKIIVKFIKRMNKLKGKNKNKLTKNEKKNYESARRSIYANKNLKKNYIIRHDDLVCLRPFKGSNPIDKINLIGRKLKMNLKKGSVVKINNVK